MKTFSSLRCMMFPDGRQYMTAAPSVECWKVRAGGLAGCRKYQWRVAEWVGCVQGAHWVMVSMSLLYIPGVLLGLPIFIFTVLRRHIRRGTLVSLEVDEQWGFLHASYEVCLAIHTGRARRCCLAPVRLCTSG
eukprot:2895793-Rhodomonas_salina.1